MILSQHHKPAPGVIGLAFDESRLWAGDWDASAILELDEHLTIRASHAAPGRVYGMAFAEERLCAVIGRADTDDRSIHRFDTAQSSWEKQSIKCPDATGSHLAWDGGHLWLGQRYAKRVLQLHADGTVKHVIDLPWEVTGFTWRGATLWLNVRVEKGISSLATLAPGADEPDVVERLGASLASLADDGGSFWTAELRGERILKITP
jgi:hypothetical protein